MTGSLQPRNAMATRFTLTRRQWLSSTLAGVASPCFPETKKPLRFAVVPQFSPLEMSKGWAPMMAILNQVGLACELIVHPSIASFEKEFMDGLADFVYLNPYHMVMAHQRQKYQPLLHDATPLRGALIVKKSSPITTLSELDRQRVSFPAPNAFAASLYIRAMLEKEAQVAIVPSYGKTHSNAIRQVLTGDSQAAGVVVRTLEREPIDVQSALSRGMDVLHCFTAQQAELTAAMAANAGATPAAFLEMALQAQSRDLLSSIQLDRPVVANYQAEYAPMGKLKLEDYVVLT